MKARATAEVVKDPNAQLKTMSLALGEIQAFIDELAKMNLGGLLQTKGKSVDLRFKVHLVALLQLVIGPLSERAGGLSEEEEAIVTKAIVALK